MRPVLRVERLSESDMQPSSDLSSPMECSLPDLVFAMEDQEDSRAKTPVPFEMSAAAAASTVMMMGQLLAPKNEAELMLARHVELACGGAHKVDPAALVAVLQRLGYSAKLQEATASVYKFKFGVRHQYLTVCLPDTSSTGLSTYIVEPNFRDCFCVAHPTPRYAAVLDGIPAAVIADRASLHRAVNILSREMARSFADQGEDLPPWRSTQALLSKWQLAGSAGAGSSSAAAAAAAAAGWAQGAAGADLFAKHHHAAFGAA